MPHFPLYPRLRSVFHEFIRWEVRGMPLGKHFRVQLLVSCIFLLLTASTPWM
jgi:hypothetical protein